MKTFLIALTVALFVILMLLLTLFLMYRAIRDENIMAPGKRRFFLVQ